jgi:hypothetical protein
VGELNDDISQNASSNADYTYYFGLDPIMYPAVRSTYGVSVNNYRYTEAFWEVYAFYHYTLGYPPNFAAALSQSAIGHLWLAPPF